MHEIGQLNERMNQQRRVRDEIVKNIGRLRSEEGYACILLNLAWCYVTNQTDANLCDLEGGRVRINAQVDFLRRQPTALLGTVRGNDRPCRPAPVLVGFFTFVALTLAAIFIALALEWRRNRAP